MAQYVVDNFRRGVDTRRPAYEPVPGTLRSAVDVHITSGGDIETRKAFVPLSPLPSSTHGLAAIGDTIYVFGSDAAPASPLPSEYAYQQLAHPAAAAMTGVIDVEPFDGKPYVIAAYGDDVYHFYDGARVLDYDPYVCRYRFVVTDGTVDSANKVTSITVDSVEILDTDVAWTTSNENTAALIAAQINSTNSTPEYTAYNPAGTAEVVIVSADASAEGLAVVVTPAGDVAVDVTTDAMEAPITPGRSAKVAGAKMYTTSGAFLRFSAVGDPTNISPNATGGGYVNISHHSSGSDDLMGTELYYEDIMVFAEAASQRWHVEADDSQNSRLQTFRGAGLVAARAAQSYLDGPTFFLSQAGVRQVRTQDSSGRSGAVPASEQVDRELVAYMKTLAPSVLAKAIMLTEPEDDRLWVMLGERIYVRSWFPEDRVAGWTEYRPGFTTDHATIYQNQVYLRSGDDVYIYGGTEGDEYYDGACEVQIPFVNMRAPPSFKGLLGLDVGVEGEWQVFLRTDPDDPTVEVEAGFALGQTYDQPVFPLSGHTPYVSLRLVHERAERGVLSSIVLHFQTNAAD